MIRSLGIGVRASTAAWLLALVACSSSSTPSAGGDAGNETADAAVDAGKKPAPKPYDAGNFDSGDQIIYDDAGFPVPNGDGGSSPPPPPPPPPGWLSFVGSGGAFGQTFDGFTWDSKQLVPNDLLAVTCADAQYGWAAGARGFVAKTTDTGRTWTTQYPGLGPVALRAVRFGSRTLGMVAGDGGALAVTDDGGDHWRSISTGTTSTLRAAAIAKDAGILIAVGDGGVVVRSADAGVSWSKSTVSGDLRGVAADDAGHLMLAVDTAGSIWSSGDGGATFAREAIARAGLEAVAVQDDGSRALAVGDRGVVMERAASGAWTELDTGTTAHLYGVLALPGFDHVGGANGTLLRRSGAGFTSVPLTTTSTIFGLDDL